MNINTIVNNAKEYIGLYREPVSDLSMVLSSAVSSYSEKIYDDYSLLEKALSERNIPSIKIHQISIMTKVDGFKEIAEKDDRIQQIDIERYLKNAVEQTGFSRDTILDLTSSIAYSLGIKFSYQKLKDSEEKIDCAYTIPMSIYEQDLANVKEAVNNNSIENLSDSDIEMLESLAAAGIPQAKYYLGYCLLNISGDSRDKAFAIDLLNDAAKQGVSEASAVLGDYYYNENKGSNWSKAYDYYTGYGALSLTKERKEALVSILNQKSFTRKTLGLNIILSLIILAGVIFAPGSAIFASHLVIGIIFFVLIVAENAIAIMHNLVKPYDSNYFYVYITFIIWAVFTAIRIIF